MVSLTCTKPTFTLAVILDLGVTITTDARVGSVIVDTAAVSTDLGLVA